MAALTADNSRLLKAVALATEPVEVYDTSGRLLGYFSPAALGLGEAVPVNVADQLPVEETCTSEAVLQRLHLLSVEAERRRAAGISDLTADEAVAFIDQLRSAAGRGSCATP